MKKLFTLLLCACGLIATAQTLRVTSGSVHHVYNATADEIVFFSDDATGGSTGSALVAIGDTVYKTNKIDSIVVGTGVAPTDTITVVYYNGTADVTIPGTIAPYVYATVNKQDVSITVNAAYQQKITYVLSGTTTDGSFTMDGAFSTALVLNSLTITSSDTAAINILNGKHCDIYVNGTNTFADGASGEQKGAFFCNGHATFHGSGTVNITGRARHGYRSDEYTIFDNDFTGKFNILSSAGDGINVQQYLRIANGTISVSRNTGDGIDVSINNDSTKAYNGQLFVSGGIINANATNTDTKAVKTDSCMTITGGTFNINVTGNGCKGLRAGTHFKTNGGIFNINVSGNSNESITETGEEDSSRCQGIRSKNDFYLLGDATNHPTFNINNTSSDTYTYGIRIKGYFYYVAAALSASGFKTKDAKWPNGKAKRIDNFEL